MRPARLASSLIMAGTRLRPAAITRSRPGGRSICRRASRSGPWWKRRPAATVPVPPTPALRPGSVAGLEQAAAGGRCRCRIAGSRHAGRIRHPRFRRSRPTLGERPAIAGGRAARTPARRRRCSRRRPAGVGPTATAANSITVASSDDDPDHLVGLERDRRAAPARRSPNPRPTRRPRGSGPTVRQVATLRLFFYPEIGSTSYRTLTYEIDDRDPTDSSRRSCVGGLLKNHAS